MRFIVLGTSSFTLSCTEGLLHKGCEVASIISLPQAMLPNNSVNIFDYCTKVGIEYHEFDDINSEDSNYYLRNAEPDYIFSTWPHIIASSVLEIPKFFVIGTHPTPLPMGRGRHPLHWLIVLGIPFTSLSFFVMKEGIDNGDLLLQKPFSLGNNISDAYQRMCETGYEGTKLLVEMIRKYPQYAGVTQGDADKSYWRKRDEHDVTLDPRMTCSMIQKIINSFHPPYPGAILHISRNIRLRVTSANRVDLGIPSDWYNYEHGFVFEHNQEKLLMRVEDGVLQLLIQGDGSNCVSCLVGKKIRPPSYYLKS